MKKYKFRLVGIIGLLGLCSFSNADFQIFHKHGNVGINSNQYSLTDIRYNNIDGVCYICDSNYCPRLEIYNNDGVFLFSGLVRNEDIFCGTGLKYKNPVGYENVLYAFTGMEFGGNCPICPECQTCDDPYTSLECQQQYSLMPINSCNTEYCEMNNLCATTTGSDCPYSTGESQLFINDIRHESTPFINLYIPEEIQRNYNYTGNGTQLDIDVEGYGYDQEKMQNMVNTQYYKPTNEEMSQLIEKIADFLPLVAVALLIIWIGRVLKKVFKF